MFLRVLSVSEIRDCRRSISSRAGLVPGPAPCDGSGLGCHNPGLEGCSPGGGPRGLERGPSRCGESWAAGLLVCWGLLPSRMAVRASRALWRRSGGGRGT